MTPELLDVDVSAAREEAVGDRCGVRQAELDALVERGRQVHDDLLLARARGQVGFGDLYLLGREAMRARDAAEALASRFQNVVLLTGGAEADVSSALLDSLTHPYHNLLPRAGRAGRPRLISVDSVDAACLGAFLESFPVEQTLLVATSAGGGELGALVKFAIVRDMLKMRIGPGFQDHLVVVTDPRGGVLREEALREGLLSFEVPHNVPARYAALTPIGLFPAAIAGVDVRGVLAGAHAAAERTAGEDLRNNPAYLLAAVVQVLASLRARTHVIFAACSAALGSTARQLAGLMAESLGGAEHGGVGTSWTVLPRDADSLTARCVEGRQDAVVITIEASASAHDRVLPANAPGLEWLAGRQLHEVGDAEIQATLELLRDADVPVVRLRMPALTANAVGALHMTSMLAAAFGAGLGGASAGASESSARRGERAERLLRGSGSAPD